MEGNKKLYYILMGAAVVLLTASYGVGFYVGRDTGYSEAKKEFEIEKKKLLKTIASLTPLSRPKPEEKVVVVNAKPEEKKSEEKKTQTEKEATTEVKTVKPETSEKKQNSAEKQAEIAKKEEKQINKPSVKTEKVSTKKNYFIQVGIFRSEVNAKKLVKKLSQKGIPATVDRWKGYYRVKTQMLTQDEAKALLKRLKEEMKLSGIVKRR
ncbi:SPOR domain-containing protein [Desulfurobacterium atlanticum]|uniref:Cell division protein FtsN n=1 Tax=Desulfurobacterium atlanticum TaxID=240169 RepID=A0A239A0U5_9BACT|nr:SPOR domain-containing protein [Desulfurobacterium atlanticum]SNR89160.1 cell division protein FtsN [Desulfurobacterium atlanticum]